jgi:hypothetical protein
MRRQGTGREGRGGVGRWEAQAPNPLSSRTFPVFFAPLFPQPSSYPSRRGSKRPARPRPFPLPCLLPAGSSSGESLSISPRPPSWSPSPPATPSPRRLPALNKLHTATVPGPTGIPGSRVVGGGTWWRTG